LKTNFECPQLHEWIRHVIDSGTPFNCEIQDISGQWFALRIWPYSGIDERTEGAVIALVDINAAKKRELRSGDEREALSEVLEAVDYGLAVLDGPLNVQTANGSFCRMCNVAPNDVLGKSLFELGAGRWNAPGLRRSIEKLWSEGGAFDGFEVELPTGDGGRKQCLVSARRIDSNSRPQRLLLTFKEKPPA